MHRIWAFCIHIFYINVIREFWQEKLSLISYLCIVSNNISFRLIWLWGTRQRFRGAFSTPFLLLKILIFVTMNKKYIYYALGVAVIVGAYYILKPKSGNNTGDNFLEAQIDQPTMKALADAIMSKRLTVDQIEPDIKIRLTEEQLLILKSFE